MIKHYLQPNDQAWALDVAHRRWRGGKGVARYGGAKEAHHQVGAMAELAFCRALDLEWPHFVDTFTTFPDVFPNWEVRYLSHWQGVKVLKKDDDDRLCVWVAGKVPNFQIMGYLRAGGVKHHPEWWQRKKEGSLWLAPPSRMVEINPDFHDYCGYARDDYDMFRCAFCGKEPVRVQP